MGRKGIEETHIHYTPSTRFCLEDKHAGSPWITRLPFPVHIVERVETHDRISGNQFTTHHAYHHGYFDGFEREFRGFGMVEQWDTEEFAALEADGRLEGTPDESKFSEGSRTSDAWNTSELLTTSGSLEFSDGARGWGWSGGVGQPVRSALRDSPAASKKLSQLR